MFYSAHVEAVLGLSRGVWRRGVIEIYFKFLLNFVEASKFQNYKDLKTTFNMFTAILNHLGYIHFPGGKHFLQHLWTKKTYI